MANDSDWYPTTRQGERDLYGNIEAKIDSYKAKYAFLTDPYQLKIHTMCQTLSSVKTRRSKTGTEMWQPADKSNVSPINFTPPLTTPGVPEKFEFCAVYIIKNERVGQWSQIYTVTVG